MSQGNENKSIGRLEVPGATIYYELSGSGPLLLLIPGANGETSIFDQLGKCLSKHFSVVAYDRRGFSRSFLTGPQDYKNRLATDVDDAKRLLEHLSDVPAVIYGSSSGAIVALELLVQHPNLINILIAHEPPLVNLLPDGGKWRSFFQDVYDIYRASGVPESSRRFAQGITTGSEAAALEKSKDSRNSPYVAGNVMYWYERELLQYTAVDIDLKQLRACANKLILATGRETITESCLSAVNRELAERLGLDILDLPGAHVGYLFFPAEFAEVLQDAVAQRHAL